MSGSGVTFATAGTVVDVWESKRSLLTQMCPTFVQTVKTLPNVPFINALY